MIGSRQVWDPNDDFNPYDYGDDDSGDDGNGGPGTLPDVPGKAEEAARLNEMDSEAMVEKRGI